MNPYRFMAMTLTSCTACLSLAACSAGITTASTAKSRSPATSRTASSPTAFPSHTTSASAGSGDTVSVDAPIGSFQIPHGAQVIANTSCGKQIIIELGSVTPAQASSFYVSELPRAGYKITGKTLLNDAGNPALPGSEAEIEFTGHGYKGTIAALSNMGALASRGPSPVSVPSSIANNFLTISLTPRGTANPSAC
jgi:hypothetical protein